MSKIKKIVETVNLKKEGYLVVDLLDESNEKFTIIEEFEKHRPSLDIFSIEDTDISDTLSLSLANNSKKVVLETQKSPTERLEKLKALQSKNILTIEEINELYNAFYTLKRNDEYVRRVECLDDNRTYYILLVDNGETESLTDFNENDMLCELSIGDFIETIIDGEKHVLEVVRIVTESTPNELYARDFTDLENHYKLVTTPFKKLHICD